MIKKLVCLCTLLIFLATPVFALADTENAALPPEWQQAADSTPITMEEMQNLTFPEILTYLWDAVCSECTAPVRLAAKLCAILILSAFAKGLCNDNLQGQTVLELVLSALLVTAIYADLLGLFGSLIEALEENRILLTSFVPVFASVMASCGQAGSALLYSGTFFTVSMLLSNVLCSISLPLLRVLMAMHIAGAFGSVVDLSAAATACAKWLRWLLLVCATVFSVILGLQNTLAGAADSLSLQAGRLLGSSIPVVGRAVSDAMGSVLTGMKLMKSTVGFALLAGLGAIYLPLLLRGIVYHAVLTAGSLVANATENNAAGKMLAGFADCLKLVLSILLFFFMIVLVATLMMILLGSGSV